MTIPQPQNKRFFFICLPYLTLSDVREIDFGFAKIWNFDTSNQKYITDEQLKAKIDLVLANYKTHEGYRVRGVGLIQVGKNDFREFNKTDQVKANDARLILFISFLSRSNTIKRNVNSSHWMASSDNFEKIHFSIVLDSDYMTEWGGFAVPMGHGGIDIKENKTIRPRYVPTPLFREVDQDLFDALIRLRKQKPKYFRRIISAIELFYESYYNSSQISHNARILLQASAFEVLLGILPGKGRRKVKNFIKNNLNNKTDKKYRYSSERDGAIKEFEVGTKKEIWADRFFTLRNHIAHGLMPKPKEYIFGTWQRHFDIALYFFIACLNIQINEGFGKIILGGDIHWKSWVDDLRVTPIKYVGFEFDSLGIRYFNSLVQKHQKRKFDNLA